MVTAIDAVLNRVTLRNDSGQDAAISAGIRLILVSNRPTVYRDPFGTEPLGSSVTADSVGRAVAYIGERKFDYTVGGTVGFDSPPPAAVLDSGSSFSWTHNASGTDRCVLVGISWRPVDPAILNSVVYAGQPMNLIFNTGNTALYVLSNPPPGPQTVSVQFSGNVSAVGGSLSLTGVDQGVPVGVHQVATGISAIPSVTIPGTIDGGMVLDVLRVGDLSAAGTADALGGQTRQWIAATSGSPLVMGAGSTTVASGGKVLITWNLVGTQPAAPYWELIAVPLRPVAARLYIDAEGPLFDARAALNVLDYPSFQAAVTDLPTSGGIVSVPHGQYDETTRPRYDPPLSLPDAAPVHLIGAGRDITTLRVSSTTSTAKMLLVRGSNQIVEGMTLRRDGAGGDSAIVISSAQPGAIADIIICECEIRGKSAWGILFDDLADTRHAQRVVLDRINIEATGGIHIAGKETRNVFCRNCRIANFTNYGVQAVGIQGLSLINCVPEYGSPIALHLKNCLSVLVDHCWFENPGNFAIYLEQDAGKVCGGIVIEDCLFIRTFGGPPRAVRVGANVKNVRIINPFIIAGNPDGVPTIQVDPGGEAVVLSGAGYSGYPLTDVGVSYDPAEPPDAANATVIVGSRRLRLPRLTTEQRDALTDVGVGDIIYNVDAAVNRPQVYTASGWRKLGP